MAIKITYHGPYKIPRVMNQYGGFDLNAIEYKVGLQMPESIALASGIYIFIHRRGEESWRHVTLE
jgi:hypothetical protein